MDSMEVGATLQCDCRLGNLFKYNMFWYIVREIEVVEGHHLNFANLLGELL